MSEKGQRWIAENGIGATHMVLYETVEYDSDDPCPAKLCRNGRMLLLGIPCAFCGGSGKRDVVWFGDFECVREIRRKRIGVEEG